MALQARHTHPPPETPRRGRTRDRLLDAAFDVFADQGVHAATIEQITDHAGFTRGAFYSNFSTKEELFFALKDRENELRLTCLAEQVETLRPRLEAAGDPLDEEALGELLLEFLVGPFDNRKWCLVQSEFTLMALRDPAVSTDFLAHRRRFEASLVPIVNRALDRARLTFVVPARTAVMLLVDAFEDALRSAILAGSDVGDVEEVRATMAQMVLALTLPADA
ncbi:helix-turn-helix domain-containing protein [Actinotalea sp.]|uniref:TetR/AcrR family transcriptional regulator n=1 Tax=Actinotalea sp. TaxID=1872145 RepID=UPI002BB8901C|nr:helix-turn-helix domain-containing protein [Actinotalea sp.]HRA51435.1 helix-turn-helix domain-containing protein [Actinotalea sp.]